LRSLWLDSCMSKSATHSTKHVDYDEFVNDPEILGLSRELAVLRTLVIEFRESMDNRHVSNVNNFIKGTIKELQDDENGWELEDGDYGILRKAILSNFCKTFGQTSFINARDVSVMAKLVETIGKLVEKAKKIEDGITVDVDWKGNVVEILQKFIQFIVCPVVKDPALVAQVCYRAREFFSLASSKTMALTHGEEIVIVESDLA